MEQPPNAVDSGPCSCWDSPARALDPDRRFAGPMAPSFRRKPESRLFDPKRRGLDPGFRRGDEVT